VWQPNADTQQARRRLNRRSSLVGQRTAIKNRIHAVLTQRLMQPPADDLFRSKMGRAWLANVTLDEEGRWLLDSDRRLLLAVEDELAKLDEQIARTAYVDPRVRLLMTLPGVDVTVAQALLAALADIDRFPDADHVAGYLGLVPSTKQSANHCYHGPITKRGNTQARWLLVQAAQHVRLHPGPLGVFFRRLAKKKNYNVAVVATARKLAVIAWHMLRTSEPYRYAQPTPTQTKLARLRVKATGQRRRAGPPSGSFAVSKCQPGVKTRTVKPLARVYQEEALPPRRSLTAGEARMVQASGVADYVASLASAQVHRQTPRRSSAPKPVS
jgi:hypothetical protein